MRRQVLACRDALDAGTRTRHSAAITQRLLGLPAFGAAATVAAYASFASEYDTAAFLAAVLARGKRLLLPRMLRASRTLELREIADPAADLVAGVWGIREPSERCPQRSPDEAGFILVPGVAFTAQGARLGYGGGYYDRLLAGLDPDVPRIAAAFSLQVVEALPMDDHDQRVTTVVTEV